MCFSTSVLSLSLELRILALNSNGMRTVMHANFSMSVSVSSLRNTCLQSNFLTAKLIIDPWTRSLPLEYRDANLTATSINCLRTTTKHYTHRGRPSDAMNSSEDTLVSVVTPPVAFSANWSKPSSQNGGIKPNPSWIRLDGSSLAAGMN